MQSAWRVACVRIPRFPIGAVWQAARAGARPEAGATPAARLAQQLSLPLPPAPRADASGPDGARGGVPNEKGASPNENLHWDERPVAVADGGRLRAVSAAAGRARVRAGMGVAEARARCAALEVLTWDDVAVEGAVVRVTAALLVASPQVTPVAGAPGMWWVGAGGLDAIGGERGLVRTLLRVASLWHPRPRVGVAGSCVAARAATWGDVRGRGCESAGAAWGLDEAQVCIVPRDGCAAYLAPAPLGLVPMEEELRAALQALGLRTVGAFAALEARDVESRWGAAGLAAWRLARGEDRRRPVLARAEARREVVAELAMPAETMEPVLFLVRAALDRLVRELVSEGRAAAAVAITLTLDDGRGALPSGGVAHTVTREVRPAAALARVAPLFERCRGVLDRWTLSAPVCGVAVAVVATAPLLGEQGDVLRGAWRDPGAADAALERLRSELGPGVVVRPEARDAHRPEAAGAWVEGAEGDEAAPTAAPRGAPPNIIMPPIADERVTTPLPNVAPARDEGGAWRAPTGWETAVLRFGASAAGAGATRAEAPATGTGTGTAVAGGDSGADVALRLLVEPEAVRVECDAAGVPTVLWWRERRMPLAQASGPERLTGDWWKERYARDYWRCDGDGSELLLFRDRRLGGEWYVQGWYD